MCVGAHGKFVKKTSERWRKAEEEDEPEDQHLSFLLRVESVVLFRSLFQDP